MPISLGKRVYGLIRTTFSPAPTSTNELSDELKLNLNGENSSVPSSSNSFIKNEAEIYSGKTGLDLPVLLVEPFSRRVRSAYTGPDGGLIEVGGVRRQQLISMVNLDDELCLSFDGESLDDYDENVKIIHSRLYESTSGLLGSCSSLIGSINPENTLSTNADNYDWKSLDEDRCFGVSVSLYEKNPLTGINAGNPIADVFGVIARDNNAIIALADGVNWGEGARLAARCAIRGAIDHLNQHLFNSECRTTTEIFHALLGAFHSAHALILQEGGLLTTLCVGVTVQLRNSNTWVLCVCNVGDSLCFVYNPVYGVREVTVASHDICQMRDMRDAGGALGPVDGINPQLHNLTCSMTFVEPDDVVFITSDGISDNFDPVVGKFCVVKKEGDIEENCDLNKPVTISVKNSGAHQDAEFVRTRTCNASLPCVDAEQRHELMLMRMGDIISNGILPPSSRSRLPSINHVTNTAIVSTSQLCHNLIQFAMQLSMAKRRTLEDPELYRSEKHLSRSEQRNRRKMVRYKLSEMPGKLDHATVVAFKVGLWPDHSTAEIHLIDSTKPTYSAIINIISDNCLQELLAHIDSDNNTRNTRNRARSPYEETPIAYRVNQTKVPLKKHARGTIGRHTLSVDVAWLKKVVVSRNSSISEACRESSSLRFVQVVHPFFILEILDQIWIQNFSCT
ncbi:unnamed protein product [Dracunculus medinensis]|uniref:PPM-type phosphatase domain-containing protein n=1 Tax=Dracunculus medinensis TaxID=318479 RepID=A0A0N4URK4_DRAME|nr:unnamed protein product [Dracunculus medinensis]